MSEDQKENEPFGENWKKEMMTFNKKNLVEVHSQICKERSGFKSNYDNCRKKFTKEVILTLKLETRLDKIIQELKIIETGTLGFVVGLGDNEPYIGKYLAEVAQRINNVTKI